VVITGAGGSGKTTFSSLVLEHGALDWRYQGDDYLFIDGNHRTLAYATRAHLYRDILKFVPRLAAELSFRERVHLAFFGNLRRISGDRIKWPLRISLERIWPTRELDPEAELAAVLLLERGRIEAMELQMVEDRDSLVKQLLSMNFREARHFKRLIEKHVVGEGIAQWWEDWRSTERELLSGILAKIPLYRLRLPLQARSPETENVELVAALEALLSREQSHA
jgi:hypothetical protein